MAAIIAELGLLVEEATAFGSEALAGADSAAYEYSGGAAGETAASTYAKGTAAGAAKNEFQDAAENGFDYVFGSGAAQEAERKTRDAKDIAYSFTQDMESGRGFGSAYRDSQDKKEAEFNAHGRLTQQEINHLNAYLAQKFQDAVANGSLDANGNGTGCQCSNHQGETNQQGQVQEQVSGISQYTTDYRTQIISQNAVTDAGAEGLIEPPIIIARPVDNADYMTVNQATALSTAALSNKTSALAVDLSVDDVYATRDFGKLVGAFIVASSFNIKDSDQIVNHLTLNPEQLAAAKHVLEFQKSTPKDIDLSNYLEVRKVYHGRSIINGSAYISPNNYFAIKDEVGSIEEYVGRQAPVGSSTFYLLANGFLPPMPGTVWAGPSSPNNELPKGLFDTYCMMHDIEYNKNGWFYRAGDLKFISRLDQNMNRFNIIEKQYAEFSKKWFSTVGSVLSKSLGSLPPDIDSNEYPEVGSGDDLYSFIDSSVKKSIAPTAINYTEFNSDYLQQDLVNIGGRTEFYAGIRDAVSEQFMKLAPFSPINLQGTNSTLDILGSLTVLDVYD